MWPVWPQSSLRINPGLKCRTSVGGIKTIMLKRALALIGLLFLSLPARGEEIA